MVTPNIEGKFIITLVNRGNVTVLLRNCQVVGSLNAPAEIIASIDMSNLRNSSTSKQNIESVMDEMVAKTNLAL